MKRSRWDIYDKFEKEQKKRFLKALSGKKSIALLGELYDFAARLSGASKFDILERNKIDILTKVHLIFNKVK